MKSSKVAIRYARALLEYASEKKGEDRLYEEMSVLSASFRAEPGLQEVIDNPTVSSEDKQKLIKIAGGIETSDVFNAFVQLISDNKRETYAAAVATQYIDMYRRNKGILTAKLTSAEKMSGDMMSVLKKAIIGTAYKSVDFTEFTDDSLIGGFILDIEFERLDASVSNQLRMMKKQLLEKNNPRV